VLARLGERETARMVRRLRDDLESGAWRRRNGHLLGLEELDLGYRLLIAEQEERF